MKNMLIFLVLFGVISCATDDDNSLELDCIKTPLSTSTAGVCDDNSPDLFCSMEYFGTHALSATSKGFFGIVCQNQNNELTFINENSETQRLKIKNLRNRMQRLSYSSNISCDDGTGRKQGRCLDRQSISYELHSSNDELELIIEISGSPEYDGDGIGDKMLIKRVRETSHLHDFEVIIDQGSFKEDQLLDQEYHNSLMLNNRIFTNVISADISFRPAQSFKYYVNEQLGLFAFKDREGETWILEN